MTLLKLSKMSSTSNSPIQPTERMEVNFEEVRQTYQRNDPGGSFVNTNWETPRTDTNDSIPRGLELASVQMVAMPSNWFQMMMLMPGLASSLMFVGTDIIKFLHQLENLFRQY